MVRALSRGIQTMDFGLFRPREKKAKVQAIEPGDRGLRAGESRTGAEGTDGVETKGASMRIAAAR
jgi:hypothetical protein